MDVETSCDIINHTSLLNFIAEKINAKSYLEIGTFNRDHNFNKIKVDKKVCVDPEPTAGATVLATSDEYFSLFQDKYDLVLIDGLHHADQFKRDILNAWKRLNEYGVIVCHDCNPHSENITHVPRSTREWTGDIYKVAAAVECKSKFTIDFDYGCMCLIKWRDYTLKISDTPISWQTFDKRRKELLNLKSIEEAVLIINAWK